MPEFQQGLFGCFSNCTVCLITYFIPCYTAGKVAEKVGESCCLHAIFLCIPIVDIVCGALIRQKVRQQKGIEGSLVGDFLAFCCCTFCALCQEANEVNAFGGNMAVEEAAMPRE